MDGDEDVFPYWRRTVAVVWTCQFMAMSGAGLAYPFLPFYLRDFGITGQSSIALWTGVLGTAAGASLFLFSPIWGVLADRFGRKRMLLRSYFAGVVVMAIQGFAPNVWWLLAMRIGQGVFMGSTATATALVAANVPRNRLPGVLGLIATASFISQVSSPLIGGVLGVLVGFRLTFIITAVMYAFAGLFAWRFLSEGGLAPSTRRAPGATRQAGIGLILSDTRILLPIGVLFVIYCAPALSRPVVPLLLESFDATTDSADAGLVFASLAITSVFSSVVGGRVAGRMGTGTMLTIALSGAGALFLILPFAGGLVRLMVLMGMVGLFSGSLIPVANALLGQHSPDGRQGTVFGFAGSAQAAAIAVGPVGGGLLVAGGGIPLAFQVTGTAMLGTATVVFLVLVRRTPLHERTDETTKPSTTTTSPSRRIR